MRSARRAWPVADEPASALEVPVRAQILNLLLDLRRDLGPAMVFVSHDIQTVRPVADRILTMYLDRIVEQAARRRPAPRRAPSCGAFATVRFPPLSAYRPTFARVGPLKSASPRLDSTTGLVQSAS